MEKKTEEPSKTTESTWEILITPHGEADVEKTPDGKEIFHPLKTEELKPLPPYIKEGHISDLKQFHSLLVYLQKHYPNRRMPITREEFIKAGADIRYVKQLMDAGLLKGVLYPRQSGSRACLYYTPQGRALIREKVDPTYALTENTQ